MIHRFFCPGPLSAGVSVALPDEAAHHATRVLRLRPDAAIEVFDGEGHACAATLDSSGTPVMARLTAALPDEPAPRCRITLVQALATGDKMDWVVQKAVELGVSDIQPVSARRSVVRLDGARAEKRLAHWRKVAVSACEQCGRNRLPQIHEVQTLTQWLVGAQGGWVLAPAAEQPLRTRALPADGRVTLLVGPEGGWDDDELAAMRARGIEALSLGPRVLRTETAGLAAVAAIQALWGDF
ncbi:16S rRNA (uracil(1498)-N(3))-methyltransferase [Denitromonas sp. IR12]|uniref:Ribosomal RNA small subunit methyltransferase E n=2 Tax=Denitromonas iodatirespirans TaxID=2795389 RepID=A0A944H9X7_DENI1|nr:16S rRNA (uracil(1498)-N(3))-methyltransferase [Denitromonas iodatirespirans]